MLGTVCTVGTVLGLTRQARKCTYLAGLWTDPNLFHLIRKFFAAFGNYLPDPDPHMAWQRCKNMNGKYGFGTKFWKNKQNWVYASGFV